MPLPISITTRENILRTTKSGETKEGEERKKMARRRGLGPSNY